MKELALLLAILVVGTTSPAWAQWTLKKDKGACALESNQMPVPDGYQESSARVSIDRKAIRVRTESVLDPSFTDLGLRVDDKGLVAIDGAPDRNEVIFEKGYARIIEDMKKGKQLSVQLRFWPTWPATGTHAFTVGLKGFTAAYGELLKCD